MSEDLGVAAAAIAVRRRVEAASAKETSRELAGGRCVLPGRGLPALGSRDMPLPVPLRKMLGPSILLLGVSLGSGEFIVFPSLTHQFGFVLMWAAWVGLTTQWVINMEIERYTLLTGETICSGFARLAPFWAWAILVMNIVPWAWPGWATGAGKCIEFAFGGSHIVYSLSGLVGIGLALSLGPVIFRTVLFIQTVLIAAIFTFMIVIGALVIRPDLLAPLAQGVVSIGTVPDGIDWPLFLTALAFAGAGGTLNICQSHYVRDKQYGMAGGFGVLRSPITGQHEPTATIGYSFDCTRQNLTRWKTWWRTANWEHVLTFLVPGLISIFLLSVIAYATIGTGGIHKGMGFVQAIGDVLGSSFGGGVKTMFLMMGAAILFTTELGILDTTARISSDILKTNVAAFRRADRLTTGHLYVFFVWLEIVLSCVILGLGLKEPMHLLRIAGSLNAIVMVVYCGLLLYMNGKLLHPRVGMSGWRFAAMLWAFGFYGYFSLVLIKSLLS